MLNLSQDRATVCAARPIRMRCMLLLGGSGFLGEELGYNAEFIDRLDHHADVVAQNLAQYLIHLTTFRLTADETTEFGLDHPEACLDVGTLVVVSVVLISVITIEVNRSRPDATTPPANLTVEMAVGSQLSATVSEGDL